MPFARARIPTLASLGLLLVVVGLKADVGQGAAVVQLQLGQLLVTEGRYADAAEAYERAWRGGDRPTRLEAGRGLLVAWLRTAEFRRARDLSDELVALAPADPAVIALRGDALWAAGQFDLAEARYRDALTLAPGQPRARNGLAKTLAARSQLEAALDEASAAVTAAPREAEFHHTLGYLYQRLRRFPEAATAYSSYINLLPNKDRSEQALWARQQVRYLQSFGTRVPSEIEGDRPDLRLTMPFRLVRDKIIVQARVNGGAPSNFVLDTGAELTVVTKRTAERAGITPIVYTLSAGVGQVGLRGLQLGRMDSFQIGPLTLTNVPTLIKNPPLTDLPTREAESFSPLAYGLSVAIDYRNRVLTIGRSLDEQPAAVELPLHLHRLAMVKGFLNGDQPVHFVVDTGGEVISISRATLDTIAVPPAARRIPLKVYGVSGWDPSAFLLPGMHLAFDEVKLSNLPVVVLDLGAPSVLLGFELGGTVGHRFLSKYSIAIDLQRSVLRLSSS